MKIIRVLAVCLVLISVFNSCKNKRPKVLPSATITYGEAFFLNECARCHGDKGEGNSKKDIPRLRGNRYTFDEIKNQMFFPEEDGIMPAFDQTTPDSIIHQISSYLNEN